MSSHANAGARERRSSGACRRFSLEAASSGAQTAGEVFQMEGGARAWKKERGDGVDANWSGGCSSAVAKLAGSGSAGGSAGSEVAASWISAQMEQ